jgi:uncharacterized membrane protein/YHS domain-containing protein
VPFRGQIFNYNSFELHPNGANGVNQSDRKSNKKTTEGNIQMNKIFALLILVLSASFLMAAEPINTMCPVTTDEAVEAGITTVYQGKTIGFCCKSCLRKFNANPQAYLENLAMETADEESGHHSEEDSHADTNSHADADSHAEKGSHSDADSHSDAGSAKESGHDHATDHQEDDAEASASSRLLILLGKLHVLVVHLPIALLPLAGIFELIGIKLHSKTWQFSARINFIFGGLAALTAASFGWIAASQSNYTGELAEVLQVHRWLGVSVASLSLLGLLGLLVTRGRHKKLGTTLYRITLFVLLIVVPITAHFGGSMIYGTDYLF